MLRKPQEGDFIPRDLIKDKETLDALHALAKDQNPPHGPYGQWHMKEHWDSLVYAAGGYWTWRNMEGNSFRGTLFTACTPEAFLGPKYQPGDTVEVLTPITKNWQPKRLVGFNSVGRLVIEHVDDANNRFYNAYSYSHVRPHRSKVQKALDKLQGIGPVTDEVERTVKNLNALGLLKE